MIVNILTLLKVKRYGTRQLLVVKSIHKQEDLITVNLFDS